MSQQPSLLDRVPARTMTEASREAWDHVASNLTAREIAVFRLVHGYLERTGHQDVTGGELAQWSGQQVVSVRPRLTGLCAKGWLLSGTIRASRCRGELRCHPYWPSLPLSAIERVTR